MFLSLNTGAQNWLVPDTGYKDVAYPWMLAVDTVNKTLFTGGRDQTVLKSGKWENWYGWTFDNEIVRHYKDGKNIYPKTYVENQDNSKPRTAFLRFSNSNDMDTLKKMVGDWTINDFTYWKGRTITSLISNGGSLINYHCIVEFKDDTIISIGRSDWDNYHNFAGAVLTYKDKLYTIGRFDSCIAVMDDSNKWKIVEPGFHGSWKSLVGMVEYNKRMYVYGGFWKFQNEGNPGNSIAAWDGERWDSLEGGANNIYVPLNAGFDDAVVCGGKLFLCGNFTHVGGMMASRIVSWNDTSWCTIAGDIDSMSGRIVRLACLDDTLYAAGDFSNVKGVNLHTNIAKLAHITHVDSCSKPRYKRKIIAEEDFDFKYYPNPTKDKITIEFMANKNSYHSLSITNSLGQFIYSFDRLDSKTEIDLSIFSSGVYHFKITGDSGQKVFKIVKN